MNKYYYTNVFIQISPTYQRINRSRHLLNFTKRTHEQQPA